MRQNNDRMRRHVGAWTGTGAALVAAIVLVVFWVVEGLEPAGWLAGVLGAFAALGALALTFLDRARAQPSPPDREPSEGSVTNTFTGDNVYGNVVMGRDFSGPIGSGPGTGPPPSGDDEEPGG